MIIAAVEGVECVGIINNYIKQQSAALCQFFKILYCATQNFDQQVQFIILLSGDQYVCSGVQQLFFGGGWEFVVGYGDDKNTCVALRGGSYFALFAV